MLRVVFVLLGVGQHAKVDHFASLRMRVVPGVAVRYSIVPQHQAPSCAGDGLHDNPIFSGSHRRELTHAWHTATIGLWRAVFGPSVELSVKALHALEPPHGERLRAIGESYECLYWAPLSLLFRKKCTNSTSYGMGNSMLESVD